MATKVRYKIPSQAASGAETFSDNLVGVQITDGTSQLTNTNFALDRLTPEKDTKTFTNLPFSDFITLENLENLEDENVDVKFKNNTNDAGKSLYGSLKQRINVSIVKIINNFPASAMINDKSIVRSNNYTLSDIVYDTLSDTTQFNVELSIIKNPFNITFKTPITSSLTSINEIRNFYKSFRSYVIKYNNKEYNITNYSEPDIYNYIKITVEGKPFGDNLNITDNVLILPNSETIERFFYGLDEIESQLLNRETNPKYTATFKVPKDSFDNKSTVLANVELTWPIDEDNHNLLINGVEYYTYIEKLKTLSEEIDDYKSNLIVRFLTSPQLFEFDTEDKSAESIFQLYGQNFDRIKKYIDNIALMRNVSYDGIDNLPDFLLKNLSQNLGFESVNLIDKTKVNDLFLKRYDNVYNGNSNGKNSIEAEHEFYRRLLTNLSFLMKSKGTRKTLEFFLKFLGAPESMIRIDEYVYNVTKLPNVSTFEDDIYNFINNINEGINIISINETTTGVTYNTGYTSGSTSLTRNDYPIDSNGLPRKIKNDNVFFQKGAGWYDLTLDHRSELIVDTENSVLTGRTKYTKTKNKPFTYGEEYFNHFRNFSGLTYGFDLTSEIDNKKISLVSNKRILNRKNINVYLSPAKTIDFDIWRQSRNLEISFGELTPQTNVTFAEYVDTLLSKYVKNSNIVKYEKTYLTLNEIYRNYIENNTITPYNFITLNEFIDNMTPNWIQLIEQFIPATTLWSGGNLIENNKFGRSKYAYKKPCQVYELNSVAYPNYQQLLSGYTGATSFYLYPIITIDGIVYGNTNNRVTVNLPITDVNALNLSWSIHTTQYINKINTLSGYTRNNVGKDNEYGTEIGYSAITGATITSPILKVVKTFIDSDGVEKIKFNSYKYGCRQCTVMKSIKYDVLVEIKK